MLVFVLILVVISSTVTQPELASAFNSYGNEDINKVYPIEIPANLSFSEEVVPLTQPDIKERLDKELLVNTYWQSNMLMMIKRANRYFPQIEKILA